MGLKSKDYLISKLGNNFPVIKYFEALETEQFKHYAEEDLLKINDASDGDYFFGHHASFIQNYSNSGQYWLGIEAWLSLLDIVKKINPNKYKIIHKGTPYYMAGIFCLLEKKYEEGLEFIDFALSQDFKIHRRKALTTPSGLYLLIAHPQCGNDSTQGEYLFNAINNFGNFINKTYRIQLDIIKLMKIISKKVLLCRERARRSAWASLLSQILSFEGNARILRIAPLSKENQTLAHLSLVKMSLILETLLKKSPISKRTNSHKTLNGNTYSVYNHPKLTLDKIYYDLNIEVDSILESSLKTFDYKKINRLIRIEHVSSQKSSFLISRFIRNNVNHTFQNTMISEKAYKKLFVTLFNSQLYCLQSFY